MIIKITFEISRFQVEMIISKMMHQGCKKFSKNNIISELRYYLWSTGTDFTDLDIMSECYFQFGESAKVIGEKLFQELYNER